jgi:MYXO-CTERM domain-containing protein
MRSLFNRRPRAARAIALAAASIALCAAFPAPARAQFAPSNPPATFFVNPTSTMGTVTGNTLVLTPLANGFVVSGQVFVTIPAGPSSGVLVQWSVIRRIDPAFSGSGLMTNTVLTGFSSPPVGTFGTTSGIVTTDWRFFAGSGFVGGSQSSIPMTLVNGIDNPAWTGLTASSGGSGFTWTAGFFPGAVMQQDFTLFGNYTSGPGGVWVIDVPVTSITVPAPGAAALLAAGGLFATRRRRTTSTALRA